MQIILLSNDLRATKKNNLLSEICNHISYIKKNYSADEVQKLYTIDKHYFC